jgi:hypothetical protein
MSKFIVGRAKLQRARRLIEDILSEIENLSSAMTEAESKLAKLVLDAEGLEAEIVAAEK